MRIPFTQVDAFSAEPFGGNPAAVMPLSTWLDDEVLLAIARENNLSETAFVVPATVDDEADFELRWFTPAAEVALCGHATLASGHVVLDSDVGLDRVRFATRQAGMLEVARADGGGYRMALPAWGATPKPLGSLVAALGVTASETLWHDKGYAGRGGDGRGRGARLHPRFSRTRRGGPDRRDRHRAGRIRRMSSAASSSPRSTSTRIRSPGRRMP